MYRRDESTEAQVHMPIAFAVQHSYSYGNSVGASGSNPLQPNPTNGDTGMRLCNSTMKGQYRAEGTYYRPTFKA